jgi:hypothetical protein
MLYNVGTENNASHPFERRGPGHSFRLGSGFLLQFIPTKVGTGMTDILLIPSSSWEGLFTVMEGKSTIQSYLNHN